MSDADGVCAYWDPTRCEGSVHCPPRCPRFVDREGDPWVVRPADADDRDSLVEMYDDFAPTARAQGVPPRRRSRLEHWVEDLLAEGCNVVAEQGGTIAGHALYTPTDDAAPEFAVFVHQDYQGRGVGTEISKHVVAVAAVADRDALSLVVEANNHVARTLYDRLGFQTVDTPGADYSGRHTSIVRMERPLGADDAREFRRPPVVRDARPES